MAKALSDSVQLVCMFGCYDVRGFYRQDPTGNKEENTKGKPDTNISYNPVLPSVQPVILQSVLQCLVKASHQFRQVLYGGYNV